MRALLMVMLLGMAGPLAAAELRISFGGDSLRAEYLQALGTPVADSAPTLHAGLLYRDEDDEDGTLAHAGIVVYGDVGSRKSIIQGGIGGRIYGLSTDPSLDGLALAMGGSLLARLPDYDRFGAFFDLWYAPGVSSFADIEQLLEINLGVEYQLLRQASLGIGWRLVEFRSEDVSGTLEFENSAFVAFKFLF